MTTETGNSGHTVNPDLEKLVKLQSADSSIQRKKELLKRLPKEIEEGASALNEAEKELKSYEDTLEEDRKLRKDLEMEVESIKEKIVKDKIKLSDIKTNVEYRAMIKELGNYGKKIEKLEDQQLSLMEKDEKAEEGRASYLVTVKKEQAAFAIVKEEKEAAVKTVNERLSGLEAERKEIVSSITPSVFSRYEKILVNRDGVGVAEVLNIVCQACHQKIQPQLYYNIRTTDELISCPHCNRFLFYDHEKNDAEDSD